MRFPRTPAVKLVAGSVAGAALAIACWSCFVPLIAASGAITVWFKGAVALLILGVGLPLAVLLGLWLRRHRASVCRSGCGPSVRDGTGLVKPLAQPDQGAIACDLGVFTDQERRSHIEDFERVVVGRALAVEERADGYALRFPPEAALFLDLSRWAADERRCCPFLTFALELEPAGGDLWLRLGGGENVKQFLGEQLADVGSRRGVADAALPKWT